MPDANVPRARTASRWMGLPILLLLVALPGCLYSFQAGAGLPSHVRTVAVVPFDNNSDRFDLAQEIYEAVLRDVPRAFGVRVGAEDSADVVIRGVVRRYNVDAPSYRPSPSGGAEVLERAVNIGVEIQVLDMVERTILWENRSLTARGVFLEGTEQEEDGRVLAVEQIVRDLINGLQTNW
jgi:TolB-like protein